MIPLLRLPIASAKRASKTKRYHLTCDPVFRLFKLKPANVFIRREKDKNSC